MREAALILGLVMLGGCAQGDDPTPEERLAGAWGIQVSEDCAIVYVFGADGGYDYRIACVGDGPGFDLEVYAGKWSADEERIRLEPEGGTCPPEHALGADQPSSFRYGVQDNGETLRTTSADGVVLYQRIEDDGMPSEGGTVYTFGCFTPDGFEPRAFERW